MKIEIEEGNIKKEFKPFVVKIEVETIQEARLLFHTFNRRQLSNAIFSGNYGDAYDKDIASNFEVDYKIIWSEILKQGFEI